MGRSPKSGLTQFEAETFRLSISAACRKMTAEQILDLADSLHDIIRKRAAIAMATPGAGYERCGSQAHVMEGRPL